MTPLLSMLADGMPQTKMDSIVQFLTNWLHSTPVVGTLFILIGLDIITGLLVAITRCTLNSTVSWKGFTRKIAMVLLVGLGAVLEPYANNLPLAQIVALFYCGAEGLSIIENAGALGVPLPQALIDVLQKLNEENQKKIAQRKPVPPTVTTTVKTTVTTPATPEALPPPEPKDQAP